MAKVPGLQQRGKTYYLRLRVPTDLVEVYGQAEVNRTLKTRNYDEARVRCLQERMRIESEFDELRQKLQAANDDPDMLSAYSGYELERLVIRWFNEQDEKKKSKTPEHTTHTPEELKNIQADLETEVQFYVEEVKGINPSPEHHGMTTAQNYLKKLGITFDPASKNFQQIGHLMSRALAESARQNVRFWHGEPYSPSDKLFIQTAHTAMPYNPALPKKTLAELCDEYINDPAADRNTNTLKNYTIVLRALKEMIGEDRQIQTITREDCKQVRALLLTIPTNAAKKAKGKSLQEAAKLAKAKGWQLLSTKTVNNYLGTMSAIMNFAVNEKYLIENPASGLKIKSKKKSKRRYPFNAEQLKKIFSAPLYTGCQNDGHGYNKPGPHVYRRTRFWVPLIALFSGLRANEICQLDLSDFVKIKGIDFFSIREDNDEGEDTKQLKTDGSVRLIPVHPELKKIGLMDYVEKLRKRGETRLFPDLEKGSLGYHSDQFLKWFACFLVNAGAKKPKTSFHSFRHNFRTAIGNAGLAHDVAMRLGGWSTGSVESGYLGKLSPAVLYKGICKIHYEGLDLSHLYAEEKITAQKG